MLLKSNTIAAVTALSLMLGAAAPAQALGKNERNFLKGVAAALIVGAIVNEGQKSRKAPKPQPVPQPAYRQPAHQGHADRQPTYQKPQYQAPRTTYQPPVKTGRVIGQNSTYRSGVNDTTAAQVFNSYSHFQRVAIQRKLADFGYYNGTLDGSFGPRTHQAVYEFARTAGKQAALDNTAGAYQVYDALLG